MPYTREQIISALETVVEVGVPTASAAKILDVGTDDYLQFFKREIVDGILKGGANCCFFEGSYGSGKTHLLQLLRHLAEANNQLVAEVELSKNTDFSHWNVVTKLILEKLQLKTETGTIKSVPKILDYLSERIDLSKISLKKYQLPHVGFVNAMEIYLKKNRQLGLYSKEYLADYLLGQRIGAGVLRRHSIEGVKNPLSKRNAELVFKTVLSAFFYLGYPILILFDEIDQTFQDVLATSRKAQTAANLVRRLIDACSFSNLKGICMVFAVSPNFIPRCSEVYPALGERLSLSTQFLDDSPSWRSPVTRLEHLNAYQDHDDFAKIAVEKFMSLASELKIKGINKDDLNPLARRAKANNAGLNFRRPLIRNLASKLLEKV